jgi:hypothetical protein
MARLAARVPCGLLACRVARSARWGAAGLGLVAAAAAGAGLAELAAAPLAGPGAPLDQPALPGADAVAPAAVTGPLRVILVDGLSRADSRRLPAWTALCARGADLVVDVGFPTRSLPLQEVLWTGLTAQQLGSPYSNDARPAHPGALPAHVTGAIAVVESYRAIASSVGFARIEPGDPAADWADPAARADRVAAWRGGGFDAAAVAAVAGPAPLVMVHAVGLDQAAHHHGRRGPAYQAALASANRTLAAAVAATPPDAMIVAVADHGHLAGGGHGDAEDEVRRVRACVTAATAPAGAAIHLIDLARLLRDRLGVPALPAARGRPLAVAIAHPAPDATLPRPPRWRWVAALLVIAVGAAVAVRIAGVTALWPLVSLAVWWLARGAPSLSWRVEPGGLLALALVPALVALVLAATPRRLIAVAAAPLAPALGAAIACGWLAHVLGGPPARLPGWTGQLAAWSTLASAALALAAAVAAARWLSGDRTDAGARPGRHRAASTEGPPARASGGRTGPGAGGSGGRTPDVRSTDGTGGKASPGPGPGVRRADTLPPPDAMTRRHG